MCHVLPWLWWAARSPHSTRSARSGVGTMSLREGKGGRVTAADRATEKRRHLQAHPGSRRHSLFIPLPQTGRASGSQDRQPYEWGRPKHASVAGRAIHSADVVLRFASRLYRVLDILLLLQVMQEGTRWLPPITPATCTHTAATHPSPPGYHRRVGV
ncbi:hypothetical protein BT67DRAFT_280891 [Trichocladium antarcticum]|uniref:Uncharacterized protein n=1 Tax=Trichocladium antarcticum TaxID=1450529 RepID=A0AAN6UN36_9PEZI|nr:hypothetical protein BT67DRAFT_280891 [Trichocladium antarcticum]